MKNNSNIISSCVVALLAGVIYYILSEPVSFEKTASSETWGEDNIEKVTASVIPGEAKGESDVVVNDSYEKVTYKQKYSLKNKIYKVSAPSKKYKKEQYTLVAESKKKKYDGVQYASNTLWLDDNFEIMNTTDFDVSVVNNGGETHIVIKGKGDCKSRNNNSNRSKNTDKIAGNDYIRDDNECKIVIRKRDESDKNGMRKIKSTIRASIPDTTPVAGDSKEEKFKFGTQDNIEESK
jgi:hypothetical protein